jgi:hypothetical protein
VQFKAIFDSLSSRFNLLLLDPATCDFPVCEILRLTFPHSVSCAAIPCQLVLPGILLARDRFRAPCVIYLASEAFEHGRWQPWQTVLGLKPSHFAPYRSICFNIVGDFIAPAGSINQFHDELSRIAAVVPRVIDPQPGLGALGLFVHVDGFPGKYKDSWKHSDLGSTDLPFSNRNSAATEAQLAHLAVGQPGNQTTNDKLLWIHIYKDADTRVGHPVRTDRPMAFRLFCVDLRGLFSGRKKRVVQDG